MDVTAMAERMSSAVSAASSPPPPSEPASPAPAAQPESTPAPATVAQPPASDPVAELEFQDDPEDLNFDEPAPTDPATNDQVAQPPVAPQIPSEFEGMLPKEVEAAFLRTQRGRNILATFKAERTLREAPNFDQATGANLGGLGFLPTPDQIKEYHARASDLDAAEHEFATNPQSWVINHFGNVADGTIRDGATQALATIPAFINGAYDRAVQSGNAQMQEQAVAAFKSMFNPMAVEYLNGLYDRARNIQDTKQREQWLNAARTIEFDLTGKFRGDDQLAPPKPEDALKQREQALDAREKNVLSWQHKAQSEAATEARNRVFSEIDQVLTQDIEKAFATAGLKAAMKPFAYKAAVDAYKSQIQTAVRQNQFAFRQYNFALSKVGSNRSADAHSDAIKAYRQAGQLAIKNTYRNILKELVDGTVSQNASIRSTAAAAASQSSPSVNGGQPPAQSVVHETRVTRLPGEARDEYFQRRLAGSLGAPKAS